MANSLLKRRERIKHKVRARIVRQSEYPRLTVHRSNNHIYAQLIDDHAMKTLAAASDLKLGDKKMTNLQKAQSVGAEIGKQITAKKIQQVVFDRGCYPYKGRIKALADAVREAGVTI